MATLLLTLIITAPSIIGAKKYAASVPYKMKDNVAVLKTPAREKGQKSVLELAVAPIKTVRIGFVGLGMRGAWAVERYMFIDGIEVVALCDKYPEKIAPMQEVLKKNNRRPAAEYSGEDGWKQLCERDDIDLVYICTDWLTHTPMCVYAMEHGKHVACEVPIAMTIKECWDLVNTAERTQRHCMMLENCCYDFYEMTTLNMAQQGLFGDIVHVEGSYIHNLNNFWNEYQDNWRLEYNQKHRGDVYPTHGMGPACQLLNIHRGDRMKTLVAVDSKSFNGLAAARKNMGASTFANGDHTITLIRTERERLLEIQHNVYAERPYNRMYQLTGTEGFANKYPSEGYAFKNGNRLVAKIPEAASIKDSEQFVDDNLMAKIREAYLPDLFKQIEEKARKVGGHGGMDYIMDYRLIYCLQNGLPLDEDVYDGVEWSCLNELTRISLENGCIPVEVPDFTRGEWNKVKGFRYATK